MKTLFQFGRKPSPFPGNSAWEKRKKTDMKKSLMNLGSKVQTALLTTAVFAGTVVSASAEGEIEPIVDTANLGEAVTSAKAVAVTIIGVFLGVLVFRWAVKLIKKAVSAAG